MEDTKILFIREFTVNKKMQISQQRKLQKEWPKLIASYSPENVYNANKTALYFRALPYLNTYLFKGESSKGHKISKERVTVLCCISMSGKNRVF